MEKKINLNQTIYELTQQNPELINVICELGFRDITKPNMINTVGKIMTLPKGAIIKNISLKHIQTTLEKKGYSVTFK